MYCDEKPTSRKRVISRGVNEDKIMDRIPPASEKLFENIPWLNIMTDIAITAAIAELKVN